MAGELQALGSPLPPALREVLLASLGGLLVTAGCQRPDALLERNPTRLRVARALLWGSSVGVVCLGALAGVGSDNACEAMRNVTLLAGLSTLVGLWSPPMYAALPGVLLWLVTLRFGWTMNEAPAWWAILVQPADAGQTALLAGLTGSLAWGLYTLRDVRAVRASG